MKDITIVIPNYNGRMLLEKQLPILINIQAKKENQIKEIIIVDDASTDDSASFVKKNYPSVRIIKHKINRGFSSGVNTGVRMAKGQLIVLINSDVFPSENFLTEVLLHFNDDKVFAISFHEKGYGFAKGVFRNGFIEHDPGGEVSHTSDTFWVSGGSGIWRRDIWMNLGGMDEKLLSPFYWEDIDLCYRAQKRGYKLLWEPKALVEHHHESTIGKLNRKYVARIKERNQLIFTWKNLTSGRLFGKHLAGLSKRIILHPGYFLIFLTAIGKFSQILKARSLEKKESKVSDEAIFQKFLRK